MNRDQARLEYLKAESKLDSAITRHNHWKSPLTADLLAEARKSATAAYNAYKATK